MNGRLPQATDVHRVIGPAWPKVLADLGIAEDFLRKRQGPCPACGGTDRYSFDNRRQRGDFICRKCGAGDGFKLLQLVNGWGFTDALRAVATQVGMHDGRMPEPRYQAPAAPTPKPRNENVGYTARIRDLLRTSTAVENVAEAVAYLANRQCWPLPKGTALRAHAAVDYYRDGVGRSIEHVGRFPALLAPLVDQAGDRVSAHVTYLQNGGKADVESPRKMLSRVGDITGVCCRLMPLDGETLGVGEGIETCLSASALNDDLPTWACLNTALLGRFAPPEGVHHLVVFADRDAAGMEAAWKLRDQLEGRCTLELRLPPAPFKDWNDARKGKPQ